MDRVRKNGRLWKECLSVSYGILAAAKQHGMKQRTSGRVAVVEEAAEARPCSDIAFASSHITVCKNDVAIQSHVSFAQYGSVAYTP